MTLNEKTTIEEKLKDLIKTRYKSIREFTQVIDMPYSTIATIFNRGIGNSSVTNIIKICEELKISADELANGRIVPAYTTKSAGENTDLKDIVNDFKAKVLTYDNLTIDGEPADQLDRIAIVSSLELAIEIGTRHSEMRDQIKKYRDYYYENEQRKP